MKDCASQVPPFGSVTSLWRRFVGFRSWTELLRISVKSFVGRARSLWKAAFDDKCRTKCNDKGAPIARAERVLHLIVLRNLGGRLWTPSAKST